MPDDPSEFGWPVSLPMELAMGEASVREICLSYGLGKADWEHLKTIPAFVEALTEAHTILKEEGAVFKAKIKAQAQGMLARNWQLVHASVEAVPAHVQADLIKFTIKAAGYDASIEQKAKAAGIVNNANAFSINIDLSGT